MNTSIPICFYPLRKIMIDDDEAFSQSILLKMHNGNFTTFTAPNKALNYLLNEYKPKFTKTDLLTLDEEAMNSSGEQSLKFNINKIKAMLTEPHYDDISVLLIDYHMPEMTGVDFLNKISHLPIKKALITGETDYKIAVNAFNQGLVDIYIRKDEPDFLDKIQKATYDLEWKYFTDLGNFATEISGHNLNNLKNNNLLHLFKKFVSENNITAFCLVDIEGTFLTIDKKGNYKYFLIRNKDQLEELSGIAKEDGASEDTVMKLEHGSFIPFFNDKNFWEIPATNWDTYLHPANAVDGTPGLVWAVVDTK